MPEDVQGSSLRFANHHYPTGDAHSPEIRVVSVVGDVITGEACCAGSFCTVSAHVGQGYRVCWLYEAKKP